jgi:hypothetical protein
MSANGRFSLDKTGTIVLVVFCFYGNRRAVWGRVMRKLLAAIALAIIGGGAALSIPASATDLTFTVQGTVTSFIDVDNVYGFGAGANLAGDAVTDVYTIDTGATTLTSGVGPYGPGSSYQEYIGGFGSGSLSSTIGGSTITINITNGDYILEYNDLLVSPPQPYNRSLLELQAIGDEATGNAIGSEFLIRDEVVSYSMVIPVPLNGLNLSSIDFGGANAEGGGVFFPYVHGATAGFWNLTLNNAVLVPESSTWGMMLLGFAGLGFAGYRKAKASAVFAA